MITEEIIKKRREYYTKPFVLFEILKASRDREVVIMDKDNNRNCIRGLKFHTINYIKDFFDYIDFWEKNYNIYISVAQYSDIPFFSWNLHGRSKYTSEWFKNISSRMIYNYDYFFDFDKPKKKRRNVFIQELMQFDILCKNSIEKYYKIFSGNNYQFVFLGKKNGFDSEKIKKEIRHYIEIFNISDIIDTAGMGVHNKIMKCPYSLVEDKVVLPIDSLQYPEQNFKIDYVLENIKIKNRGLFP